MLKGAYPLIRSIQRVNGLGLEIRRNGQLSAFDGSHGVDNEDILSIPDIDFSTFQIFPGQATYGPDHPDLSPVDNTAQVGVDWIQTQAAIGAAYVLVCCLDHRRCSWDALAFINRW
jgi:hypothetical protein